MRRDLRLQQIIAAVTILLLLLIPLYVIYAVIQELQPKEQAAENSPYGFTVLDDFSLQTVARLKELGVTWIRYQHNWRDIEPEPNTFHWQRLDEVVTLANANGIHITFPIQGAPTWALGQTCLGARFLPEAATIAAFAGALARRYNGTTGHGLIDSYEIGNEEYDSMLLDNQQENLAISISCRHPGFYGPNLQAAYQAIKHAAPHALVGMFGLWWESKRHIAFFMDWLYRNGYGRYFDFANFHYYICSGNPARSQGDRPSFNEEWRIIHTIMAAHHDGRKPIWVTEVGWTTNAIWQNPSCIVTPQVQAYYVRYILNAAMQSHAIDRVFWYTIDRGDDGMSLTHSKGPLPGFYIFRHFVKDHRQWASRYQRSFPRESIYARPARARRTLAPPTVRLASMIIVAGVDQ